MNIVIKRCSLWVCTFFIFISCQQSKETSLPTTDIQWIPLKEAKGFRYGTSEKGRILQIFRPYIGAKDTLTYLISDSLRSNDSYTLPFSPKKVVCLSTIHASFLQSLGLSDRIIGMSGTSYVYDSLLKTRIDAGEIKEVSSSEGGGIRPEVLLSLEPDLVLAFSMGTPPKELRNLPSKGIPVLYLGEYLENTPLGRAEWLRALAWIFGIESIGDPMFEGIYDRYTSLKSTAAKESTSTLQVFCNIPYQDVWYMPQNQHLIPTLIRDAGGSYIFSSLEGHENTPLALETVLLQAEKADVWILAGTYQKISELKDIDPRLAHLKAIENGQVYNTNNRMSKGGGVDYHESGPHRPDLVLKDLVSIFKESKGDSTHQFFYMKKLDPK